RSYKVRGLCCADEVAALKQAVGPLVGGAERLAFDVLNGRMTIAEDGGEVAEETIITAVAATGMSAVRWTRPAATDETDHHRREQVLFTAASGAFVLIGLVLHVIFAGGFVQAWKLLGTHGGQTTPWAEILAYVAAALLGARFVAIKAWYAARN